MEDFKTVTIIGMGLIGGSIALGLKHKGFEGRIIGTDADYTSLKIAKEKGAIDEYFTDPVKAVKDAELVIIAVPVGCFEKIFKKIAQSLLPNAMVTDVGSVKEKVTRIAKEHLPRKVSFIGGHPMAGSEKGGMLAASATLLENAYYFITPDEWEHKERIEKLKGFIAGMGAYPVVTSTVEHDMIVAKISHIPHLMATVLVNMVEKNNGLANISFAGGGFRDTTRVASGNPELWRDIFLYNKQEMMEGIERIIMMLEDFKELIRKDEKEAILENLRAAKIIRETIPQKGKDSIPQFWEVIIDLEDRPGILAMITRILGDAGINIKDIEIVHARQGESGALKMSFESKNLQRDALALLRSKGFQLAYEKGEE